MVCLPSRGACWGLVEVYTEKGRFKTDQPEIVQRLARVAGERLEQLERP